MEHDVWTWLLLCFSLGFSASCDDLIGGAIRAIGRRADGRIGYLNRTLAGGIVTWTLFLAISLTVGHRVFLVDGLAGLLLAIFVASTVGSVVGSLFSRLCRLLVRKVRGTKQPRFTQSAEDPS